MKKRTIATLLIISLLLGLCGCGTQPAQSAVAKPQEVSSKAQEIPDQYRWDLTAIYADNAAFEKELKTFEEEMLPALSAFEGKLNTEENILAFMRKRNEVDKASDKLFVYVTNLSEQNQADNAATVAYQKVSKAVDALSATISFADAELLTNSSAFLDSLLEKPEMQPFETQISRMRTQAKHVLPQEEKTLLIPLSGAANGASTLYSKLTMADMIFPTIKDADGNDIVANETEVAQIVTSNPDREFRKDSVNARNNAYGQYRNTLAQNMDNFLQATVSLAHSYHYQSAKEMSMAVSDVPVEVYDALIVTANNNLATAHRNAELRKKILGVDVLYSSDMNYPLVKDLQKTFSYDEAQKLIIEALAPLGSDYQANLKKAFNERWIDVYPAPGKNPGGFSIGLYGVHPFILMNYTDDYSGMTILAHELGHTMHQYQSAQAQPSYFTSNPSAFTSEVASITNELFLSDYLIKNAKSDEEKLYFLFSELNILHGTFFTQTLFAEFEEAMYQIVEDGGSVTADTLEQLWRDAIIKYDGSGVTHLDSMQYGWYRIPHFYYNHYVYQYATSIAAASSIVKRIEEGEAGAVEAYQNFLRAGDSGNGVEIIKLAGVDMTSPQFADDFMQRYNSVMNQIEELTSKK